MTRSYVARHVVGQGELPLPNLIQEIYEGDYAARTRAEIFSSDVSDSLREAVLRGRRGGRASLEKTLREVIELVMRCVVVQQASERTQVNCLQRRTRR